MLENLGIAKEQASRVLPTFKMMKGVVTATYDGWMKFLELRDSPLADVAMQELAKQIKHNIFTPDLSTYQISDIHLPFWRDSSLNNDSLLITMGRIARVSYLSDRKEDELNIELGNRLLVQKHLSPPEHIARWDNYYFQSAICNKFEDQYYTKEGGIHSWTNLRAYYEENGTIEDFIPEHYL
jgi:hypothetical protein